mmetsp:Transcript_35590/g.102708  ORF Transcript_35590/g.102708 Transcript_35590/m.102708 type:complete len:248 (+) Transcript_35590:1052-1795(+)
MERGFRVVHVVRGPVCAYHVGRPPRPDAVLVGGERRLRRANVFLGRGESRPVFAHLVVRWGNHGCGGLQSRPHVARPFQTEDSPTLRDPHGQRSPQPLARRGGMARPMGRESQNISRIRRFSPRRASAGRKLDQYGEGEGNLGVQAIRPLPRAIQGLVHLHRPPSRVNFLAARADHRSVLAVGHADQRQVIQGPLCPRTMQRQGGDAADACGEQITKRRLLLWLASLELGVVHGGVQEWRSGQRRHV